MNIHPILLDKNRRIVAGHRGMMAVYPENTLLSFEQAIALGVDMLEMDINVSRDGELIVIRGGHHLHMEQPDEVAAAIGDFFDR